VTTTKKWVIGGAVVLGVFLLFAAHNNQNGGGVGASRSCTVTVTADMLNVRSNPDSDASVVQTYHRGDVVAADRTILNGFRQLAPDHWAMQDYLAPTPGSDCG